MVSDVADPPKRAAGSAAPTILARIAERHVLLLALLVLAANAVLLVSDGAFWDGLLTYRMHREHDYATLRYVYSEGGLPQFYYLHRLLGSLPGIVLGYRLACCASLLTIALLVDRILARLTAFTRAERTFVALAAAIFPAFQVSIEVIVVPYVVLYAVFIAGVHLALVAWNTHGPLRYVLRALALALLLVSFALKSLLVLHFAFLGLVAASRAPSHEPRVLLRSALAFARDNLDFLALAPVFLLGSARLFPVHGTYADYNTVKLSPGVVIAAVVEGTIAITRHANDLLATVFELPLLFGLVWVVMRLARGAGSAAANDDGRSAKATLSDERLLLLGLLGIMIALFPYAAVGKAPSYSGWNTRHAMLVGLPMGVTLLALVRLATRRLTAGPAVAAFVLACLSVAMCARKLSADVAWQARWVHDRAVVESLRLLPDAREASIFVVKDEARRGLASNYRPYEWATLFNLAWGGQSHIGFDEGDEVAVAKDHLTVGMTTSQVDVEGCRGRIVITPGSFSPTDLLLVVHYQWARVHHADIPALLRHVVTVAYAPAPGGGAHCIPPAP